MSVSTRGSREGSSEGRSESNDNFQGKDISLMPMHKRMIFFCVLCVVAVQPAFAQTPPTGSGSTGWTAANWVALVTGISSAIVAIIGALKAYSAQSKADSNGDRLTAVSNRLNSHGEQINA